MKKFFFQYVKPFLFSCKTGSIRARFRYPGFGLKGMDSTGDGGRD